MTRAQLEDLIERAIDALDHFDGDADAEPSLGSIDGDQRRWSAGARDGREQDDDCELSAVAPTFR